MFNSKIAIKLYCLNIFSSEYFKFTPMIWSINCVALFFKNQKGLLFIRFKLRHSVSVFPKEQVQS